MVSGRGWIEIPNFSFKILSLSPSLSKHTYTHGHALYYEDENIGMKLSGKEKSKRKNVNTLSFDGKMFEEKINSDI